MRAGGPGAFSRPPTRAARTLQDFRIAVAPRIKQQPPTASSNVDVHQALLPPGNECEIAFESRSTWLSLHRLRIDLVVFLKRSEKTDHHDSVLVPHLRRAPRSRRGHVDLHKRNASAGARRHWCWRLPARVCSVFSWEERPGCGWSGSERGGVGLTGSPSKRLDAGGQTGYDRSDASFKVSTRMG